MRAKTPIKTGRKRGMKMKKAILLGDFERAGYHSMKGIDPEICEVLGDVMQIDVCTEYDKLTEEELNGYDIMIDYIDGWMHTRSPKLAAMFIRFVANGKTAIMIHCGGLKGEYYELTQLYGGSFAGHPPYTMLSYEPDTSKEKNPVLGDMPAFCLPEEPYAFDLNPFTDMEVFLWYSFGDPNGNKYCRRPAGWTRRFAKGKVLCLVPGHNVCTFRNETYRDLLHRCGVWAAGE